MRGIGALVGTRTWGGVIGIWPRHALVDGSETNLLSSYAAANNWRANQALTLVAPGRGVSFGFEDKRPLQWGNDHDFNDVIVTITPGVPTLIV